MAATSAMYVSSTSARRSAQSVPRHSATRSGLAAWGSHSAGKRTMSGHRSGGSAASARSRSAPALVMAPRRSRDAALEIHGEVRIGPAVDRRPLALLPAARIEALCTRCAEARFDLAMRHAAGWAASCRLSPLTRSISSVSEKACGAAASSTAASMAAESWRMGESPQAWCGWRAKGGRPYGPADCKPIATARAIIVLAGILACVTGPRHDKGRVERPLRGLRALLCTEAAPDRNRWISADAP
jgi:hypothetical protein